VEVEVEVVCGRIPSCGNRREARRGEAKKIEVERQGNKKDNERNFRKSA